MLAIRTILHPTDFSERSAYAFQLACSLARDYGARLVLVHVHPTVVTFVELGPIPHVPGEVRKQVQEQLGQLKPPDAKVRVEHVVKEGDPAIEILRVAEETHCDLIVMGTHGRTGLGRVLMGSVAEQIVRRACCPVLTVRTPFPRDHGVGHAPRAGNNLRG